MFFERSMLCQAPFGAGTMIQRLKNASQCIYPTSPLLNRPEKGFLEAQILTSTRLIAIFAKYWICRISPKSQVLKPFLEPKVPF